MEFKQETIGDIIESENLMILNAAERFGDYFINAAEFNDLLQKFIKSVDTNLYIFANFLREIRKHHTLSLFSIVRQHRVQAMMDLRQVLEAGTCAAYAIANPDRSGFVSKNKEGFLDPSQELTNRRYQWLEKHFKTGSDTIKKMKNHLNETQTHSNLLNAAVNCGYNDEKKSFVTPFFDKDDDWFIKNNLWFIANIALCLMDLFYGVNKTTNGIIFQDNFVSRLKYLEAENNRLKLELINTDRFKKIQGMSVK